MNNYTVLHLHIQIIIFATTCVIIETFVSINCN